VYPYELHLNWVASVAERFKHLAPSGIDTVKATCYLHDSIEDARLTYNDVRKGAESVVVAEAVFLLTNLRGRTREERANDEYYEGIRNNKIAQFVKLCDRIANMEFGVLFGGSMVEKYRQELPNFLEKTGAYDSYPEMAAHLKSL
jgi:(p)ppGpp synthase/HD superfamily hydrolase